MPIQYKLVATGASLSQSVVLWFSSGSLAEAYVRSRRVLAELGECDLVELEGGGELVQLRREAGGRA